MLYIASKYIQFLITRDLDFNKGKCSQSDVPVRISPVL